VQLRQHRCFVPPVGDGLPGEPFVAIQELAWVGLCAVVGFGTGRAAVADLQVDGHVGNPIAGAMKIAPRTSLSAAAGARQLIAVRGE